MRVFLIIVFSGIGLTSSAQTPQHGPKADWSGLDSNTHVTYHPSFMLDTNAPFFTWDIKPKDFEFTLFDRWGNIMGKTTDPDFIIDNILSVDRKELKIDTYVAKIIFTDIKGEKHTLMQQYNYLGWYCGG